MYQFRYTIRESDYFEFNRYHAFNSQANKENILVYHFGFPVLIVAGGLIIGTVVNEPVVLAYCAYISCGIAAILWFIFYKRIVENEIKRNMEKIKKDGKLPCEIEMTLSFEDDFFVEMTKNDESRVKYSAIERVIKAEKAIYIYINAIEAILLPFSLFTDEQECDDFIVFCDDFIVFIEGKCVDCLSL